ncbi:MAG: hypothetical protein OXB86_06130 [Bdellovibrionales bacterium]|nr:hypothetical protein [Bdellovibrionales bacterium]
MKKYILIIFAVFGFSALAGMDSMAGQDDGAEGFNGSVELKWQYDKDNNWGDFSYRARAGWTGSVNDEIQWGVGLTTPVAPNGGEFNSGLGEVHWEQAYVKYSPSESFFVKAGKYEYYSNFNKYGVLVDDDLYAAGAMAKFKYEVMPATYAYAKAFVEKVGDYAGIWGKEDAIAGGWLGLKSDGDSWQYGIGVGGQTNQIAKGTQSFVMAKVSAGSEDIAGMPAGVFGFWSSNAEKIGAGTYSAGAYVGDASETYGWSIAVNYYNVSAKDWNYALVDSDYNGSYLPKESDASGDDKEEGEASSSSASDSSGVAVKAQFNPWDNTNFAVKYNAGLGDNTSHGFVGEVTFNF